MRKILPLIVLGLLFADLTLAADKNRKTFQVVDSGSLAIFVDGRRVGTEIFTIQQGADSSIATAEVKIESGGSRAAQNAELEIAPNGDLRRYIWREQAPGKSQAVLEIKDQFLVERVAMGPGAKTQEIAFMVPPSTVVLDDNFFSHRQILLWRYLATMCGSQPQAPCKLERGQFGVIIPRQQATAMVAVEYKGKERLSLRGAEQELDRFQLLVEGVEWNLWLDGGHKLLRISVPSEKVEVIRE